MKNMRRWIFDLMMKWNVKLYLNDLPNGETEWKRQLEQFANDKIFNLTEAKQ